LDWRWSLLLAAIVGAVAALSLTLPQAFDFDTVFRPVVWAWLRGQAVYSVGSTAYSFLNPPWTLPLLLPFALPPVGIGRALLLVFNVAVVLLSLRGRRRRRASILLTILSLPCGALLWNGQLEGFALLGIGLGFWALSCRSPWALSAALVLMGTKPQEATLVALLLLWHARGWHWREWLKVAALPAGAAVFSCASFGLDWVGAIGGASVGYAGDWVNVSWPWRFLGPSVPLLAVAWSAAVAALALRFTVRRPLSLYTLGVIVTANTLASPYVATHHLVVPLVMAWPWLLDRNLPLALVVYLTTLSPLLREGGDQTLNWLDFLFPLALMVSLLSVRRWVRPKEIPCD